MPLEYALQHKGISLTAWDQVPENKLPLKYELSLSSLPIQAVRNARKHGFVFNIMVAGESGLGKSSFLNSLFGEALVSTDYISLENRKTNSIRFNSFNLTEGDVTLKVTLIDTPGFGVHLDRQAGLDPVLEYVDQQLYHYLNQDDRDTFRPSPTDNRVHVCLYFISPTGHSLSELDLLALTKLSEKVNIIPVIAKSDTLTRDELVSFRALIYTQIKTAGIPLYPFAHTYSDETKLSDYEKCYPFAVVTSNALIKKSDGRYAPVRQYRWGTVEVDNPQHSDLTKLQEIIMRDNIYDLIEVTHNVHYESFRSATLSRQGRTDTLLQSDKDFAQRLDEEKKAFEQDVQQREDNMKALFDKKLAAKEAEFEQLEKEILEKRERGLVEYESEHKKILAALAAVDEQLNQLASESEKPGTDQDKKKSKGILGGTTSLLRSKKT